MKKFLIAILLLIVLSAAFVAGAWRYYHAPGPLMQASTLIIKKGMRSQETANALAAADIIRFPKLFYGMELLLGHTRQFKAGEYAFPAGISPEQVSQKLVSGEVVVHKLTIPEGWNMREVRAAIMTAEGLEGELTLHTPEGSVLPETYYFVYGETRNAVLLRMQQAMNTALDAAWQRRAEGLPLANKEEALVLASIVEKETGLPEERQRVAAVFINRLKIGMRLQTDPTVIYGIEQQLNDAMNRPLTYADLAAPSPYNTYIISGLPPTPIANPGKSAIEAALHPLASDELYFVASGTGGHHFARTLEEHQKNVRQWRKIQVEKP